MKPIDPTSLSAQQIAKLVNSVAPNTITPSQVEYHIKRKAGYSIGPDNRIHIVLYIAWLRRLLKDGQRLKETETRSQAEIMRDRRASIREIGEIPKVKNKRRRNACRDDPAKFMQTYMPAAFRSPFSPDHLAMIEKIHACMKRGGKYALTFPRSGGKTTICEGSVIHAALYGLRSYLPIVAATIKLVREMIASILFELTENDLLLEDFPEVCFPFRALEGIHNRCVYQTHSGELTHIRYSTKAIVLPFIKGAESSGGVIAGYSMTEAIRGLRFKRGDGSVLRPDFVYIDDPQTDESARSPEQCDVREKKIISLAGLSGFEKDMAMVLAGTVIQKRDAVDRFLDRDRHPDWQGDRVAMLKKESRHHDDLWMGKYYQLRKESFPASEGGPEKAKARSTAFYLRHRKKMDAGARVFWEHCKRENEVSAIQHAYNERIDNGDEYFFAECQNDPLDPFEGIEAALEPRDILVKINGIRRHVVPSGYTTVVAFVDPGSSRGKDVKFGIGAFGEHFNGHILNYGVTQVDRKSKSLEAALYAALKTTVARIVNRRYYTEAGLDLTVQRIVIDSGWKPREVVYPFCRRGLHREILSPSKGQGDEVKLYMRRGLPRRHWGESWRYAPTREERIWLLTFLTDSWKSHTAERWRTPLGARGGLSLYGRTGTKAESLQSRHRHLIFAEHQCSEKPLTKKNKAGDVFTKWKQIPGRANDYWDIVVGLQVAAAMEGCALDESAGTTPQKPRRTLEEALKGKKK